MSALLLLLTLTPADPPSDEISQLLSAGSAMLNSLPALEPGGHRDLYFELRLGPGEVVGYSHVSLRAGKGQGEKVYDYASDTVVSGGNGPRIALAMRAQLRPAFEPIRAGIWRETIGPNDDKGAAVRLADFGRDKVALSVNDGTNAAASQVDRPQPPFVFAIETLVAQMKDKPPHFAIREFSVPTGAAEPLIFTMEKWQGGGDTLVARYADGAGAYQFWFDEKGELQRWMQASMPALFVRSTAERIEALEKTLGPPMKVPAPAAKPE